MHRDEVLSRLIKLMSGLHGYTGLAGDSIFNPDFIAGEDAEEIFIKIAQEFGIAEHKFFARIDVRRYFDSDWGLGLLPLAPVFWLVNKVKGNKPIEPITLRQFAEILHEEFASELEKR
jgi:hypothetical protein